MKRNNKGLSRLFNFLRRKKAAISLRADREGDDEFSAEYLAIDVSKAEAGNYELIVKIVDENNGHITERRNQLWLY